MARTRNNGRSVRSNTSSSWANRAALPTRRGPQASTRPDLAVHKRVFTRELICNLTNVSGTETYKNYLLGDYLDRYQGADNMPAVFDQYKITRTEVFLKGTATNASMQTNPVASIASIPSTVATSVIDFDNANNIAASLTNTYTNAKTSVIGNMWKRVANYEPRILASDIGMVGTAVRPMWLDTSNPSITHRGYNGYFNNACGYEFWGTTASTCQMVLIKIRVHVSFRGRRSDSGATVASIFAPTFIGSTVTNDITSTVRTVSDWRITPANGIEFQWAGSPTWHSISVLRTLIQAGQTAGGDPITYVGPTIPDM